ncbi:MAG: hypothetical protein CFK52_03720 [Chloracidobacterium sp. CP2_5A]|nr:MAG: hypothetical protein CFK52_03720 [Chloracidobacterium sp. CP2_5A]
MTSDCRASGLPAYVTNPERLEALRRLDILDTPPDGAFDRVARIAARIFEVPIALVSLVDEDRIWFKARFGLDVEEIECHPGLCSSAICSDDIYVVTNAATDLRAMANPLVTETFGLRFYAAAPLRTLDGFRLGTMCIIDRKPRPALTPEQEATLRDLAGIVMDQMELRLSARQALESLLLAKLDTDKLANPDALITICAWSKKVKLDGEWVTFEEFLARRFGAQISHGMTREAARAILTAWKASSAAEGKEQLS